MNSFPPGQVYINLIKMMSYRGATLTADPLSDSDVVQKLNMHGYVTIRGERGSADQRGKAILVVFLIAPESKHASKSADFVGLLKTISVSKSDKYEIIFVSENALTTHLQKQIVTYQTAQPNVAIESHDYRIFLIEVPKHVSVPQHSIATEEEIKKFCDQHYTTKERFPRICQSDPQAIWLGLKPGMCVKVMRLSETAGRAVAYRYCVKQ